MLAPRSLPRIGGERREISVIFTDIADFTTLSEKLDPEALAALLNLYFAGACGAMFAQGGLVYEFIGDAILAFFGAPHDQPDHADRAVNSPVVSWFGSVLLVSNLSLYLPYAGARAAVDSAWTLKVKHYTVSKVRAVIPPLGNEHDQRADQQ